MNIYLKYGTYYNGTSISWTDFGSAIIPLQIYEIPESERETGRSLRRIEYSHTISKRVNWKIIISADLLYLVASQIFFRDFYWADLWKISFDNWVTEYEVVLVEQGDMPIEFINGNSSLSEFTFTLNKREPN